jgi:hypothetical protein
MRFYELTDTLVLTDRGIPVTVVAKMVTTNCPLRPTGTLKKKEMEPIEDIVDPCVETETVWPIWLVISAKTRTVSDAERVFVKVIDAPTIP